MAVMSSEEQSNKGPAPITPPTYNISDMFRAEVGPMVKKMVDQLSQQMKDSASAEEEARQKLRSELFKEQQKLQKRVGAMLEEDIRKKPNGGFDEARDDEDEISGEEEDFSFIQRQAARRVEPDEEDKKLWMETRRMTKEFSEEDWKKVKVTRLVDYYSGHADAKVFKAMEADPEVGIRYDTERTAEKHSKELEGLVGAAAGALTSAMSKVTAVRWSFN